MTFVGRILIVVHLFLSVFFMAFAGAVYTAHVNWMKKATDLQKTVATRDTELRSARDETERVKTTSKAQYDALTDKYNTLDGKVNNLQRDNATLVAENKQVKTAFDSERELAKLNSVEAEDRTTESMQQREKSMELYNSRNDVFSQLKAAEDRLFAMDLQRQQFEEKHAQLLKELAIFRSFLASKGLPTDPKVMTATTIPPTDVEGVVLDYRKAEKGQNELVDISLGSDDDLRVGHVLTVFSDDKYLGQIKLLKVTPDRSVGLVVKKAKNTTIKRGDNVSTKL